MTVSRSASSSETECKIANATQNTGFNTHDQDLLCTLIHELLAAQASVLVTTGLRQLQFTCSPQLQL